MIHHSIIVVNNDVLLNAHYLQMPDRTLSSIAPWSESSLNNVDKCAHVAATKSASSLILLTGINMGYWVRKRRLQGGSPKVCDRFPYSTNYTACYLLFASYCSYSGVLRVAFPSEHVASKVRCFCHVRCVHVKVLAKASPWMLCTVQHSYLLDLMKLLASNHPKNNRKHYNRCNRRRNKATLSTYPE